MVESLETLHTAEGIKAMRARLARLAPPAELTVAIERPSGLLVDALIETGHPVVPIHPNVLFAHVSGADCDGAPETALHRAAKQALVDAGGMVMFFPENWWSRSESNRRPPGCDPGALPTELRPH